MKLPKDWVLTSLEDLITLNPKNEAEDDTLVGFIPMNLVGTKYSEDPACEKRTWSKIKKGYTHFANNDVLLAKITPCFENGKAGVVRDLPHGIGAGSTEFFVCRVDQSKLNPDYLLLFFKTPSFIKKGELVMRGAVGHKRVPKNYLLESQVPHPRSVEVQTKLVERARNLITAANNAVDKLKGIEGSLDLLLVSLISSLLESPNDSKLDTVQLGDVVSSLTQGWSPKCKNESSSSEDEWAVIKTTAVQALKFIPEENKKLPSHLSPREHLQVEDGDVLITRAGPRSRVGVACFVPTVRKRLIACDKVYRLRVNPNRLLPEYLALLLNEFRMQDRLDQLKTGMSESGVNLTQKKFLSLEIDIPSLAAQRTTVDSFNILRTRLEVLEQAFTSAYQRSQTIEQSIIQKTLSGDLSV